MTKQRKDRRPKRAAAPAGRVLHFAPYGLAVCQKDVLDASDALAEEPYEWHNIRRATDVAICMTCYAEAFGVEKIDEGSDSIMNSLSGLLGPGDARNEGIPFMPSVMGRPFYDGSSGSDRGERRKR